MSNLYLKNQNQYNSKDRIKFKKLRNKDSYMNAFLERRKRAADFALNDKFRTDYNYEVPPYIINIEKELMILKKKNKNQMNSVRNKSEFYKTYNTLKYSISHKSNNSSQNKIIIEKENNKYYLSQEIPDNKKSKKFFLQNKEKLEEDIINDIKENDNDKDEDKIDLNKKYNNIKHHTINVSTKKFITHNNDNNKVKNWNSWKNLKIQKISSLNNYEIKEKDLQKNLSKSTPYLVKSNEYQCEINNKNKNSNKNEENDKRKNNNLYPISLNLKENNINNHIKYESNFNNIYYEGLHNHQYYESSPKQKSDLDKNIELKNNQNYQLKSLSEPKNLYEKTKPIYSTKVNNNYNNENYNNNITENNNKENKNTTYNNNYNNENYNNNIINENKNNNNNKNHIYEYNYSRKKYEISPIKTYYRYDYKDFNDDKIYESPTLNSNFNNKSENNIKAKSETIPKEKKEILNEYLNLGYYHEDKKSNLYTFQNHVNTKNDEQDKKKNVGILYKNKKYYLNYNLDNLNNKEEIDNNDIIIKKENNQIKEDIISNEKEKIDEKENDNNINIEKNEYFMENINKENNQKESNKIDKLNDKENQIKLEKDVFSMESKSQLANNNINNFTNFNSSIPLEENNSKKNKLNNNTKIKNIKAQSYKTLSEQGYNYDTIKEKYESFLKPKEEKEEKEPNIQSKVFNSMLSSKSKEDLINNTKMGPHNKSLVKNIQEKIIILKKNKSKNNIENNNYIEEIDRCYDKIKKKEEKDNMLLEQFYINLIQKEKLLDKNNNKTIHNEDDININNVKKKEEKNNRNRNKNEKVNISENKKTIIYKSKRLENIMRNLLNNKKYNYYDYQYLSNKIRKSKSKDKENININTKHSTPDINLIVEQSTNENIKIIDEEEFTKLKRKNLRSARLSNYISKKSHNENIIYRNQKSERNILNNGNNFKYISPRLILQDITHKIMPPNQL